MGSAVQNLPAPGGSGAPVGRYGALSTTAPTGWTDFMSIGQKMRLGMLTSEREIETGLGMLGLAIRST